MQENKNMDGELREKLNFDLGTLLKKFVDRKVEENQIKFFTGIVVENNDPDQEGKCQIRVYGIYGDEIPDDDLPWSIPDFNFIGSELGSFIVPPVNAIVKVYFDHGDLYTPRYTTKVFKSDLINSFTSDVTEDYPSKMVFFETDNGEFFYINRLKNESVYRHASGLIIRVDSDGNMIIDNNGTEVGDLDINVKGNLSVKVGGNITMETSTGNVEVKGVSTTLEGSTDLTLKTLGASAWVPNGLPIDPFSGSSHGGTTFIPPIIGLKGSD